MYGIIMTYTLCTVSLFKIVSQPTFASPRKYHCKEVYLKCNFMLDDFPRIHTDQRKVCQPQYDMQSLITIIIRQLRSFILIGKWHIKAIKVPTQMQRLEFKDNSVHNCWICLYKHFKFQFILHDYYICRYCMITINSVLYFHSVWIVSPELTKLISLYTVGDTKIILMIVRNENV